MKDFSLKKGFDSNPARDCRAMDCSSARDCQGDVGR